MCIEYEEKSDKIEILTKKVTKWRSHRYSNNLKANKAQQRRQPIKNTQEFYARAQRAKVVSQRSESTAFADSSAARRSAPSHMVLGSMPLLLI